MASKTQIDRLGDRVREGKISEDDLRKLDEYRRSFSAAYEFVIRRIKDELALEPTGRPAKSTTSITEKLNRESIRLSQMQDIAGCRVVVLGIAEQEHVVQSLASMFTNSNIVDRRNKPTNGYRAVHVVVPERGKLIEIQVRTLIQHGWAELSEKAADLIDPAIKYGGGDLNFIEPLLKGSALLAAEEARELEFVKLEPRARRLLTRRDVSLEQQKQLARLRGLMEGVTQRRMAVRAEMMALFQEMLDDFPPMEANDDTVSD